MAGNPYKDEKGHYTSKENDGGPCKHEGGNTSQEKKGLTKETLVDKFNDAHLYNDGGKYQLALSNGKTEEFNTKNEAIDYLSKYSNRDYSWAKADDYENDLKPAEKKKYYVGTLDGKYDDIIEATSPEEAEQIAQEKYGKYMGGDEIEVEELEDEAEDKYDMDKAEREKEINDNLNDEVDTPADFASKKAKMPNGKEMSLFDFAHNISNYLDDELAASIISSKFGVSENDALAYLKTAYNTEGSKEDYDKKLKESQKENNK